MSRQSEDELVTDEILFLANKLRSVKGFYESPRHQQLQMAECVTNTRHLFPHRAQHISRMALDSVLAFPPLPSLVGLYTFQQLLDSGIDKVRTSSSSGVPEGKHVTINGERMIEGAHCHFRIIEGVQGTHYLPVYGK